jgi:hypothetical protein
MAAQLREDASHPKRQHCQQGSPGQECWAFFPGMAHSRQSFVQTDQDE